MIITICGFPPLLKLVNAAIHTEAATFNIIIHKCKFGQARLYEPILIIVNFTAVNCCVNNLLESDVAQSNLGLVMLVF